MTLNELVMMLKSVLHDDWEMEKIFYYGHDELLGYPFIIIGLLKCMIIIDDNKAGCFKEEILQQKEFHDFQVIKVPGDQHPDINDLLDLIYENLDKEEYHQFLITDLTGNIRLVPVPMEWTTEVYSKEVEYNEYKRFSKA